MAHDGIEPFLTWVLCKFWLHFIWTSWEACNYSMNVVPENTSFVKEKNKTKQKLAQGKKRSWDKCFVANRGTAEEARWRELAWLMDLACNVPVSLWNVLHLGNSLLMESTFLSWMYLYSGLKWNAVETAYDFRAFKFSETLERIINRDNFLEEFCMKIRPIFFVCEKFSEWRQKDGTYTNSQAERATHLHMETWELRKSSI